MEALLKYVVGEMGVIARAPAIFIGALLALTLIVWWLMDWRYSGIISNKEASLALLREQRDDYKNKLGGATPDEARARIDALERKLSELAANVKPPRNLTTSQNQFLLPALQKAQGRLRITHEGSCPDCRRYANDFVHVFRQAGWTVEEGMFLGGPLLSTGIGLVTTKPNSSEARLIIEALSGANLRFDVTSDGTAELDLRLANP